MKIKSGFIAREVAGSHIVVAVGERTKEFGGIIKLNESGLFLWKLLAVQTDKQALVDALTAEYEVSVEIADRDVDAFIATLQKAGILE